jgi:transposase, IS5 family
MNIFESSNRQTKLENLGDPLKKLSMMIDFEVYREELMSMYKSGTEFGGRPPYDPVKMFKIILIQKLYNLSDMQTEFQINDRLSFQKFIGVGEYESLPDEKTIWLFKERLMKKGIYNKLFTKLKYWIEKSGFIMKEGAIVDATIIEVPIQRNTAEENQTIKEDKIPEDWKEDGHKLCQKDIDARWVKKNGKASYGYKNHIIIDKESKIIRDFEVSSASVHDSQIYSEILGEANIDEPVFADSAYSSAELKKETEQHKSIPLFCNKGSRKGKLNENQKIWNKSLSRIRCRVEHVFADMKSFGGGYIRTIGKERARFQIFLGNFVYNIRRVSYLKQT